MPDSDLDEIHQSVVDDGSSWEEETASGTQLMEEEQLLIL